MLRKFAGALIAVSVAVVGVTGAQAAGEYKKPRPVNGTWEGPFGTFDRAQLQRGFQVYKEVCSSCHSMNLLHYRNLGDRGGPFYDPKYPNPNENPVIRAIAAEYTVTDVDADGNEVERPAEPKDPFVKPFETRAMAMMANGGAYPPDLSVITKARHGGADYMYSLISGYPEDGNPPEMDITPGKYYNPYMAGQVIAMPPQLIPDRVSYAETEANAGIEASVDQMSQDITAFLQWAGDPKATTRKQTGVAVMAFLLVLTILLYFSYKSVWRHVEH